MDLIKCIQFLIENGYAITTDCNICYGTGKKTCYCGGLNSGFQVSEYDPHMCYEENCYSCEARRKILGVAREIINLENKLLKFEKEV